MKLLILVVCFALIFSFTPSEARRRGKNCGIACYTLDKCLKQISGGGTRPGQLGNTGQLVLNSCDAGDCDCEAEKAKKEAKKAKRAKNKSTTTTTPSPNDSKTSSKSRFRSRPSFPSKLKRQQQREEKDETTTTQKSVQSRFRRFNTKRVS